MLYFLYEQGLNIFHYISVRAIIAFFLSFFITLYFIPKFIKWAKSKSATQPILEYTPKNHQEKKDTPTMGGVVFISAAIISTSIAAKLNFYVIVGLLTLFAFMLIGVIDDLGKILKKDNKAGLSAKFKFILQWIVAFIITITLYFYNFDTDFYIPFYKYPLFDMKLFAIIFWAFVIVGMSNAVNLTDGLDGLAAIPSVFSLLTLMIFAYFMGNAIFSKYLLLPFEYGIGEVVILAAALIGAILGFLWYNANPAQIFMGDSGSLSIGAIIGYLAILTKTEILLLLIGFVFIMETISVILQVGSFKTRGKRIFKMAPIHHHFEMSGWSETQITIRFWIIALITNIIAILSIKIR
ncbi:phospho-N-acetylmuramoyl-pentapeptide-transferase [Caminibacter mediatlanticus TB-2]|uniref:Phospho-N-acetylmuramoyl-pentapeptide-transferase n=1 Tax=Caminibacter mediatlanticus TB-2 TaxID=391592 RepID=A0ABX5VAT4_9BACT|nr:phospho-N-acetylmuramoyl-pentapeptide-transferase [Caminibacter mediatlanticus]QCT95104.1 phospho-N-acetylmuramoyl-pentapeptide-transferase [Caminibacter mediatlanticus TB-2]